MEAIRETVNVVGNTITVRIPEGFTARRVEVIVLPAQESAPVPGVVNRRPSAALAGTVIHDDLIEPAVPPEDWNALR